MRHRSFIVPGVLAVTSVFALSSLIGCGGKQVPEHDGYRNRWRPGWERPKKLELDEDFEAEKDGELSYPKRKRVRWYLVETPEDGELEITLQASLLGVDPEEEDDEDLEDPFDVGFELYDMNYKMLIRADQEEDDAGDRRKSRTAYELQQGKYLLHVYLQRRIDEAEFTVRVKFNRGSVEPQTNFPKNVAYVELLPVVPAVDDSPLDAKPSRPKCRGKKCRRPRRSKPRKDRKPKDPGPEPVVAGSLKGKITVIRAQTSGGTEIIINKGSNNGVAKGWKGKLVTRKGKAIPGGRFEIRSVKNTSSKAKVNVSADAVKQSGRVILTHLERRNACHPPLGETNIPSLVWQRNHGLRALETRSPLAPGRLLNCPRCWLDLSMCSAIRSIPRNLAWPGSVPERDSMSDANHRRGSPRVTGDFQIIKMTKSASKAKIAMTIGRPSCDVGAIVASCPQLRSYIRD